MTVIQLFARERRERARFATLAADYRRALFGSTVFEASLYATVEALGSVALALLIWQGGREILEGALTFGVLVAFIQYTNRFFLPIRDLGAKYTVMQSAMASAERIFALLDRAPAIVSPGTSRGPAARPGPALRLRHVWFAYEGEAWVLRDCSLDVAAGEHVALVGATGEGKSTCARLLTRAYDVQRGGVEVDSVDVREWDLARLRRHVGVVFQDPVLFAGTVADNLVRGVPDVARALVESAAETANLTASLAARPAGLDTAVGERGGNLSLGQRQLLAIARALVYNPPVLVLDEATSSVDVESEWLIRDAMKRLLTGRTSLTIAHRLSTISSADRILVLHRGRIQEDGTHAALLRRGGLYARLWELQGGSASG
jgi:ATP-binding cassette subfamily B protein